MMMQLPDDEMLELTSDDWSLQLMPGPINEVSWAQIAPPSSLQTLHKRFHLSDQWFISCAYNGARRLQGCIDVDPMLRGGVPVLHGTRFTIAEIFAEIADSGATEEIAENFDLDLAKIKELLNGFSLLFNRPFTS